MKLLIVDDQSTVVQGLLHCTNWAAMGFTVVDTALNAVDAKASLLRQEAEVPLPRSRLYSPSRVTRSYSG